MILLGFGFRAHSGKSTCTQAILASASRLGLFVVEYSFGEEALRYCAKRNLIRNVPRDRLTPDEIKVLQDVGLEKRHADPFFWIVRLAKRIDNDGPQVALVPNCRYQNEVEWVRGCSGFYVRVTRFDDDGREHVAGDRPADHPSEMELENLPADFYLTAKGGQAALLAQQATTVFDWVRR